MTTADTRMTVRHLPWFGASTALVDSVQTAENALELAGLNWEVDVRPNYYFVRVDGKEKRMRGSKRSVIRKDTFEEIGVVGGKYVPFQNRESFAFLDQLSALGEASFEAAGSMNGGSKVFIVMKAGPADKILGDEHDTYILFTASHDGTGSVTATTTSVRLSCTNMFRAAMASETPVFKARHLGVDLKDADMVAAARETLHLAQADMESFGQLAYQLSEVKLDEGQALAILEKAMPWSNPATAKEREKIVGNMAMSTTISDEWRHTGWGLLNSVTEMLQHGRSLRSSEAGLKRAMGVNSQIEARVVKALTR